MNTRWVAAQVITKVLQNGQSLTAALDNALKTVSVPQDKAFIQALCYGVCRYYHRLEFISGQLLDKPVKTPEVKALLFIGLYQLCYMRVKSHAAVSETVLAAQKQPWAKALINAVLRNYLRQQQVLEGQANQIKQAAFSHPDWLIRQIEHDWPEQAESLLTANNRPPPMTLRVNLKLTTRENYLDLLIKQNIPAQVTAYNKVGIVLENPLTINKLPHFEGGWVSVQDGAAQLAADLLDVQAGQRILDVCAAPGGKTAHMLEAQTGIMELVAVDNDENRMQRVRSNLQRLGLTAKLVVADAAKPENWWDGKPFDRILLDAPCSATGVIRRHPDIKLLRRADDINALAATQHNMLNATWPLLKTGGMLLYSTCSVLKQENELQIKGFLASHPDAIELPIETQDWGHPREHGKQIFTGESAMDGFYYARIVKH
ncbi:Ribosomal RNA small subunit methyltransferase B [biofilm metagenome]